eukprot:Colp12_sorted_trinity150504_noHs@13180
MSSFHFTKDQPDDQLYADISALNSFGAEPFGDFMNIVYNFLAQPQQSKNLLVELEQFSGKHGASLAGLKNVLRGILSFFKGALKGSLTPAFLQEDLSRLGLSQDKASRIAEQWKKNMGILSRSVVGQTLMINQLVDMEWKFGVTAGTSEQRRTGKTFLQLKLVLDQGGKTETVFLELTLSQFYEFLHELKTAKATLEYFS